MSSRKRAPRDTDRPTSEPPTDPHVSLSEVFDVETTVDLRGSDPVLPARDDAVIEEAPLATRDHLKGLIQALIFASDRPLKPSEIAKIASAPVKEVRELLAELSRDHRTWGIHLDEMAGGWIFRTAPQYAPFVRELTKQKPVKLSRAQVETLAIVAYRQPITRPDIDDVRGVDSGAVLKSLLERDLVRILGKKDEPGRPLLYGTGPAFLELFGLKSLSDLPTLREFTELNEESRRVVEQELGEEMQTRATVVDDAPPTVESATEKEGPQETDLAPPDQESETPREESVSEAPHEGSASDTPREERADGEGQENDQEDEEDEEDEEDKEDEEDE